MNVKQECERLFDVTALHKEKEKTGKKRAQSRLEYDMMAQGM